MDIIQYILLVAVLGVVPIWIGDAFCSMTRLYNEYSMTRLLFCVLFGNMLMWAAFECVTVPLLLLSCPFDWVVWAWIALMAGFMLAASGARQRNGGKWRLSVQKNKWTAFDCAAVVLLAAVVVGQIYMYVTHTHLDEDDVYFLGNAINALEYNTLSMSDYETGAVLPELFVRRGDPVCAWLYYYALLSKLTFVSPTILAHTFFPVVLVVMMYSVYWLIADMVFESNVQACLVSVFFVALMNTYFSGSAYTQSVFSLTRIWQGKAMVASIIMPTILYLMLLIDRKGDNKGVFLLFATLNTAACSLSGMGILLTGILDAVYGLYLLAMHRKKRMVYSYALAMTPIVMLGGIYIFLSFA